MNLNEISKLGAIADKNLKTNKTEQNGDFAVALNNSLKELNKVQEDADKTIASLATGEIKDLHQAALAIGKAETSMKLMLEIRNKALSAYKEISRTQI